jgi:hypothetical protein
LFVVTSSVVAVCIYMKDPHMVTTSHNQLSLPIKKCIRHRFVVKINDKRKHAMPGKHTFVCFFLSHLLHSLSA